MPKPEDVKRAIELIRKRRANCDYFFSQLQSPDWIDPLDREGIFSDPPDLVRDGSNISFPPWPEGEYLSRLAGQAADKVLSVMLRTPMSQNIRVHDCFTRAAIAMPGALSVRWAVRECAWLETQRYLYFLLPDSLGKLCIHLAEAGENRAAIDLFRALFRIVEKEKRPWDVEALMESWEYDSVLEKTYPTLILKTGSEGFVALCDLLASAQVADDYSWALRSTIEPSEQNAGHQTSIRDALIDAVRDAAALMVTVQRPDLRKVHTELSDRKGVIFRRIELHFLGQQHTVFESEAIEAAMNADNFSDVEVFHEYSNLVREVFVNLPSKSRDVLLSWIERGSAREENLEAEVDRRSWKVRWLAILKDVLPPAWRAQCDQLEQTGRLPEHPDLLAYSSSGWGLRSPKSDEELGNMPVQEIASYLKLWEPPSGWDSPVPEGLGRALQRTVSKNPLRFVKSIGEFAGVEATYARAIVQGLEESARAETKLDWDSIVEFLFRVASTPRDSGPPATATHDRDPNWGWARKAVASLLRTCFEKNLFSQATRTALWSLLFLLTQDPDPTPAEEAKSSMDPATYSINTVRGEAMHAVIQYALWVHREQPDRDDKSVAAFQYLPEVRDVLEFHLTEKNDPSAAIRAVYGQYLPWLILLDRAWVVTHLGRILPIGEESARLREATWTTYLQMCRAYDNVFDVLKEEYSRAVETIDKDSERQGADLGKHIIVFVARGLISPGDRSDLCCRFFQRASDVDAGNALREVGQSLKSADQVIPEVIERLQAMWGMLLGLGRESKLIETLKSFGWWFASGKFDASWSSETLLAIMDFCGAIEADFAVAERLAVVVLDQPEAALDGLRALIKADRVGWNILGWKHNARAVLRASLAFEGTRETAKAIINELGARGSMEFRDLLQSGDT